LSSFTWRSILFGRDLVMKGAAVGRRQWCEYKYSEGQLDTGSPDWYFYHT
jgi:hypothetical protein